MAFDAGVTRGRRVAVIGAGISGLGAAYDLAADFDVTLFEAEPRLGGHARTVMAGRNGDQPVDTGFIVFNRATYPRLCALFDELRVPTAGSEMSFAASFGGGRMEYALRRLGTLFAQRRRLVDPRFLRMVRDIVRFNARAEAATGGDETISVAALLDRLGTGAWFRDRYLLPFSGAIWSTPTRAVLDFPAAAMLRFFRNHALLASSGQHRWFTVRGGSIAYVRRIEAALKARGAEIRTSCPVEAVQRTPTGVRLRAGGDWREVDAVVVALHGDHALSLLSDPSEAERSALSAVRYQRNEAVLHADLAAMPRRRACWSAWNYVEPASVDGAAGSPDAPIGLTYWMNALQPIPQDDPLFVTLNGARPIDPALVYDRTTFRHPLYDQAMLQAQARVLGLGPDRRTWFCGAWLRNGFHEDGLWSGQIAAAALRRSAGEIAAR